MNRKNKSIYHHLQYRCNKEQIFYRSKPTVFHSNRSFKLKNKEKNGVKIDDFEQYISYDVNANSVEENKTTIDKNQKIKLSNSKVFKKLNYQQHKINRDMIISYLSNLVAGTWVPVHLILIESLIDITWQNGITVCRIPSISFIPEVFEIDEYDFFPGDFVSIKGFKDNQDLNASNTTFGCVLKATNTERITYVQWFKVDSQNVCSKFGKPEQLGSYDIKHHKKHHYHVGDIVAVAPVCSKTNLPAGCVCSVQPSKGRLSIKWYNEKETLLNPHELFGIVWDLVSDDFFSSSEDTFEISSVNLQQELENFKFENTLVSFTKQEFQIKPATELIQKILKNINAIKKSGCGMNEVNKELSEINLKNNDIMKILVAQLMELKTISKDKSINIICESFPSNISSTNELNKLKKVDILDNVNSTLPSTSLNDGNFFLKKVSAKKINGEIQILKKASEEIKPDKAVENKFNEFVLNKLTELETSLKNWFKINSINETSIEGTQNEMNEFVENALKTENPILKKTEDIKAAEIDFFQQSTPIPEVGHLKINSNLDNSLSFDGNTYDQFNQDFSIENYKLSLCDPLPTEQLGSFIMVNYNAENHKYIKLFHSKEINRSFNKAWNRDCNLLSTSLPKGIWIKNFEQRVDLFTVMIEGPIDTPYQYTLFFFDIHLTSDYPNQPPLVHYVSLTNDKVNPNLYPDGRVCLSLLGTWIGRGSENWDPKVSNLLQIIVSLQGLILVNEPYFNEAGFEHRRGTTEGLLNSQRYNESVITSLSIAMTNLIDNPVKYFEQEIKDYFLENGNRYISTLKFWSSLDDLNFKNYILTNRMSVTEFVSSSDITKSICDKISKTSIKNEANTEVISSWSEEILLPEIFRSHQENFEEVHDIKIHHKIHLPQFLLAPVSKGFSLTLNKYINLLEKALRKNEM